MRITFLGNAGGFADCVEIPGNITMERFFNQQLPGRLAEKYLIRVNVQPVLNDQVLHEGDSVIIVPLDSV